MYVTPLFPNWTQITGNQWEKHRQKYKTTISTTFSKNCLCCTSHTNMFTAPLKTTCSASSLPWSNIGTILAPAVPISSLDALIMVEGQTYQTVATCRSVGRPQPQLSWDTELNGKATNRTSESGAVSSQFSLHPLRSLNGKKLDCLVWHPSLAGPRRITNSLVVHCEYSFCCSFGHIGCIRCEKMYFLSLI